MSLLTLLLTNPTGSGLDPVRDLVLNYLPTQQAAHLDCASHPHRTTQTHRLLKAAQKAAPTWTLIKDVLRFTITLSPPEQAEILRPLVKTICHKCGKYRKIEHGNTFPETRNDLCEKCYFRDVGPVLDTEQVKTILNTQRTPHAATLRSVKKLNTWKDPYTGKIHTGRKHVKVWKKADVVAHAEKRNKRKRKINNPGENKRLKINNTS